MSDFDAIRKVFEQLNEELQKGENGIFGIWWKKIFHPKHAAKKQ